MEFRLIRRSCARDVSTRQSRVFFVVVTFATMTFDFHVAVAMAAGVKMRQALGEIQNEKSAARAPHRVIVIFFQCFGQQFVQRRRQHHAGGKTDEQRKAVAKKSRAQNRQRRQHGAENQRTRRQNGQKSGGQGIGHKTSSLDAAACAANRF